jgi:hypothetical protein
MSRCEQGYLCAVCGQEVADLADSALYLQLLLNELSPDDLIHRPDCHIRCLPTIAQYIVDPDFTPVTCQGPFAKTGLDPDFVQAEERRITAAWRHLQTMRQKS